MKQAAPLTIRLARRSDLPALIALFVDDTIGGHGDSLDPALLPQYQRAFDAIEASANEMLYAAEHDGEILGTFQLAILTKLTGQGSRTMMVQSVQVRSDMRGQGIGAQMVEFAIDLARSEGISAIQLMSNAERVDAHRFYARLGFQPSHTGFRMVLK